MGKSVHFVGSLPYQSPKWTGHRRSTLAFQPHFYPGTWIATLGGLLSGKTSRNFNLSKAKIAQWYTTWDFRAPVHTTAIYLLSRDVHFLQRALAVLVDCQRVIVTIDWPHRSASRPLLLKALKAGHDLLLDFGLLPLVIADSAAGGVTDAQHLFGLGRNLHLSATPGVVPGLPRTHHHVLDGGTEGRF